MTEIVEDDRALVAAVAALTERPQPSFYSFGDLNRAAALVKGEAIPQSDAERAAIAAYFEVARVPA